MPEVFHILQMRVQKTHELNHGLGLLLAVVAVFNGQQVFHHLLYMTAIFLHAQVISSGIIFHVSTCVRANVSINTGIGPYFKGMGC